MGRKLGHFRQRLATTTFSRRLLVTSVLVFALSVMNRPAPLLSILLALAALGSIVWLISGAFTPKDKFESLGYKSSARFVRLASLFLLVPPLLIASAATGSGIGLAISPYSEDELAQIKADELAREAERKRNVANQGNRQDLDASGLSQIEKIEQLISSEIPSCKFETLVVQTNVLYKPTEDDYERAFVTSPVADWDSLYPKDASGQMDLDLPEIGSKFKGSERELVYRICNTQGRTLADLGVASSVYGKPWPGSKDEDYCLTKNDIPTKSEKKILAECAVYVDKQTKLGAWIGIRKFKNYSELRESIDPISEISLKWRLSPYPMIFVNNIAVFAKGPFDDMSQDSINKLDKVWNIVAKATDGVTPADLGKTEKWLADYPNSFDRARWASNSQYDQGARGDIADSLYRESRAKLCTNKLVASETDFNVGACGKLSVEVFQSDLATGVCNFLGYWTDSNGNRKTGYFEYCSTYKAGSIIESRTYNLKLSIIGTQNYTTKLGYETEVLSFTVIR